MTFWRIYYQPIAKQALRESVSYMTTLRFVDSPMPHIVLWKVSGEVVEWVADKLTCNGHDVIAIQREEGTP